MTHPGGASRGRRQAARSLLGSGLVWCLLWPVGGLPRADPSGGRLPTMDGHSGQASLDAIPDRPLEASPSAPISPRFVIEHRSALNGRLVTVRGMVVGTVAPDTGSPRTGGVTPSPSQHPQPRIRLADADDRDRDVLYDLTVLLPEGHEGYPGGQLVTVSGTVDGNRRAVVLMWRE